MFEGLAVAELEKEWKKYPVFHLDLNAEKYDSSQALVEILSRHLTQWELKYGKGEDEETLSGRFAGVIRRASEQAGCGVVVLVDEGTINLCCRLWVMVLYWIIASVGL